MSKKLQSKTAQKGEKKEDEMSDDSEPDMPNFTPELSKLKQQEMGQKADDQGMDLDDDIDD